MISRKLHSLLKFHLENFPVTSILGPRQCGKSTLAKMLLATYEDSIYLDLESPGDLRSLSDPELFFSANQNQLICLDEIQRVPELFATIRSHVDKSKAKGQFLILGSASEQLIRQSSESLAGRIAYLELTPFLLTELPKLEPDQVRSYWLRGSYPDSFLGNSDLVSQVWRRNFIRTFLERDLPQLGIGIPTPAIQRLWYMCAHSHSQLLNTSVLGQSLGLSHTTVRKYLDILVQTFMIRLLPPLIVNIKKRLIKSPKLYLRDSGILHSLLEIDDFNQLMRHPCFGGSWEGMVLENAINTLPGWQASFYRTSDGTEIDLVLERGGKRIVVECKASINPALGKGFWNALETLQPVHSFVVAPVERSYPIADDVRVCSPLELCQTLTGLEK